MKPIHRRAALRSIAGACSVVLCGGVTDGWAASPPPRSQLGIVIYALGIHQRANWSGRHQGLAPAVAFLEECHELGAGGIQCSFDAQDAAQVRDLRQRAERYDMHVEAILEPPRDDADMARFENDVKVAKEAGASVARTVIIPGRRYERFKSLVEFRDYEQRGLQSLQRAQPVLARHRFRLAVENHKDQRIPEKLAVLKSLSSEWIGLCVDVGNNLALLENPLDTVRALAPWAFTVHLKDAAVRECDDGFLLADAVRSAKGCWTSRSWSRSCARPTPQSASIWRPSRETRSRFPPRPMAIGPVLTVFHAALWTRS